MDCCDWVARPASAPSIVTVGLVLDHCHQKGQREADVYDKKPHCVASLIEQHCSRRTTHTQAPGGQSHARTKKGLHEIRLTASAHDADLVADDEHLEPPPLKHSRTHDIVRH